VLAAIHGIGGFIAIIGCVVLAAWVLERVIVDIRRSKRSGDGR
jgi:flagellar biogenesis protein FliO